jgi:hypothetical protein
MIITTPSLNELFQELWGGDYSPVFGATMSLKRFQFLLSHIRFDDITLREEGKRHDKFFPAREIFEEFNEACTEALQCGDQLCVDEDLYRNFGRGFDFKQYNPSKPSKYGFLYRVLNDSRLAYTYRAAIYAGRPVAEPTENYISGVEEIVCELLRRYGAKNELKGRNLTTDRFYTSVDLAETLLKAGVYMLVRKIPYIYPPHL